MRRSPLLLSIQFFLLSEPRFGKIYMINRITIFYLYKVSVVKKYPFANHGIYLCNMEFIYSLDDIDVGAEKFIDLIKDRTVIAFNGNLGAGKTTFIKAVCKQLGVKENVSSPTFSIINQYTTENNKTVFHIDLYRIKDSEEAINTGAEECIYSGDLCFIEWPERISFLPAETVNVFLEAISETERKLLCKLPA